MGPRDFDYVLPPERIAQRPAPRRGDARMLVVGGGPGELAHHRAHELAGLLARWPGPAPLVVRNDSRVVPARVHAEREDGRTFELLFCDPAPALAVGSTVRAWVRGARRLRDGDLLSFVDVRLRCRGSDAVDSRARTFEIEGGDLLAGLEHAGQVPLPPYVRREGGPTPDDVQRYQTLHAREPGSVAAPTAGLHLEHDAGLDVVDLTLHVGPGTFLPMEVEDVREHRVGAERVTLSASAAARIEAARAQGRPLLAVGTTVVRALESIAAGAGGRVVAWEGRTDLVITPEHRFRVVDHLLTNFHLPRSSLLMLVCCFAGRGRVLAAYAHAVEAGYRFYSYGDCMLVVGRGVPEPPSGGEP